MEGEEGVGPGEVEELGSLLGEYTRTRERGASAVLLEVLGGHVGRERVKEAVAADTRLAVTYREAEDSATPGRWEVRYRRGELEEKLVFAMPSSPRALHRVAVVGRLLSSRAEAVVVARSADWSTLTFWEEGLPAGSVRWGGSSRIAPDLFSQEGVSVPWLLGGAGAAGGRLAGLLGGDLRQGGLLRPGRPAEVREALLRPGRLVEARAAW